MRVALKYFPPASQYAKEHGCICESQYHIHEMCPIHYPLFHMNKIDKICDYINNNTKNYFYCQIFIVVLLLINCLQIFWR